MVKNDDLWSVLLTLVSSIKLVNQDKVNALETLKTRYCSTFLVFFGFNTREVLIPNCRTTVISGLYVAPEF